MKSHANLRPCVTSFENLYEAFHPHLRLSCALRFVSINQYEHASRLVDEVGRLIGGWKQSGAVP